VDLALRTAFFGPIKTYDGSGQGWAVPGLDQTFLKKNPTALLSFATCQTCPILPKKQIFFVGSISERYHKISLL
jgi:hypothetical protein